MSETNPLSKSNRGNDEVSRPRGSGQGLQHYLVRGSNLFSLMALSAAAAATVVNGRRDSAIGLDLNSTSTFSLLQLIVFQFKNEVFHFCLLPCECLTFCLHQVICPVVVNLSGGKMAILLLYLVSAPIGREGEGATSANPFNFTLSGLSCGLRPSCLPPSPRHVTCCNPLGLPTPPRLRPPTTFSRSMPPFLQRADGRTRTDDPFPLLPPRSFPLWRNGQVSGLFLSQRASEPRQMSKGSFRGMSHDVSLCLFPRVRFYDGIIGNGMTFFLFGLYFTQRFCNLFGSGTLSQKKAEPVRVSAVWAVYAFLSA